MLAAVRNRGFVVMAALAVIARAAVAGLALAGGARAAEVGCLSASDTREQVKAHKLIEPYAALKSAAQQRKAEALSARLCVSGDDYVYEITLLHRDGRLMHVEMDAVSGKPIARPARDPKDVRDAHDQPTRN